MCVDMNRAKHSLTIGYASLSRLLLENAQASLIRLCTNPSDPLADNCASPAHNQNCGDKKTATGETTCGPSHQARKPAPGSSAPLRSFSQRCSGSPNPAPDRLPSERFTPPLPRFCRNPIKTKALAQTNPFRPIETKYLHPPPVRIRRSLEGIAGKKLDHWLSVRCFFRRYVSARFMLPMASSISCVLLKPTVAESTPAFWKANRIAFTRSS